MENLLNLQFADELPYGAIMKVVGVGGAGGNAVNRMVDSHMEGVEFLVMNTDIQALRQSAATTRFQIGKSITKGRGAGANPLIGFKSAQQDEPMIEEALKDTDLVFITAGMGGGTGTGAAPKVAEIAHRLGALTVAIVTLPFEFEGKRRMKAALDGVINLKKYVDTLVVIPNQSLFSIINAKTLYREAFKTADMVLMQATRGISDLIAKTGEPNLDFADVQTVMMDGGEALIGFGSNSDDDRGASAARQALKCPLLQSLNISGAKEVLVNITGSSDMTMFEVNEAMNLIYEEAGEDANVIFGAVIDDDVKDELRITVIATGLGDFEDDSEVEKETESEIPKEEVKVDEDKKKIRPKYGYDEPSVARNFSHSVSNSSQGENGDREKKPVIAVVEEEMQAKPEPKRIDLGVIDLDGEPPSNLELPAFLRQTNYVGGFNGS